MVEKKSTFIHSWGPQRCGSSLYLNNFCPDPDQNSKQGSGSDPTLKTAVVVFFFNKHTHRILHYAIIRSIRTHEVLVNTITASELPLPHEVLVNTLIATELPPPTPPPPPHYQVTTCTKHNYAE